MIDDSDTKLLAYIEASSKVRPLLSEKHGRTINSDELQQALCRALGIDPINGVDLLDHDLTAERMLALLEDFDFTPVEVLHTIELSEEDGIIPDDTPVILLETQIKVKGEIWEVHRNDADPWPSNPHAHNYAARMKLHLRTGEMFDHNRKSQGKIKKKSLYKIQDELVAAKIPLPPQ